MNESAVDSLIPDEIRSGSKLIATLVNKNLEFDHGDGKFTVVEYLLNGESIKIDKALVRCMPLSKVEAFVTREVRMFMLTYEGVI